MVFKEILHHHHLMGFAWLYLVLLVAVAEGLDSLTGDSNFVCGSGNISNSDYIWSIKRGFILHP